MTAKSKKAASAAQPLSSAEAAKAKAYDDSRRLRITENIERIKELGLKDAAAGFTDMAKRNPQKGKNSAAKEASTDRNNSKDKDFDPADEQDDGTDEDDEDEQVAAVEDNALVHANLTSGMIKERRGRGRSHMPEGRFSITQVSRSGVPTHPKLAAKSFKTACGVIGRERININTKSWDIVEQSEKELLWSDIQSMFEIQEEVKNLVKVRTLKAIGASFKQFKHTLTKQYVAKGLSPFDKYPFIQEEDWDNFVKSRESDEFKHSSEVHKKIQSHNTNPHRLGTCGYDGKAEQWRQEDEKAICEGREPPFSDIDEERCRYWARARLSKGSTGEAVFKNPKDQEVVDKIRQLTVESSQGSIQFSRENDVLTKALGRPEHPGRTRGVSVYAPWKQGFHKDVGIYRSRKRKNVAREAELIEMRDRISYLEEKIDLISQSQQVAPTPVGDSPPQIRSSCASAQNTITYPVDKIEAATPCTLQVIVNDEPMDAAKGVFYPCAPGEMMHNTVLISRSNAKVSVDWVDPFCKNVKLKYPPSDEIMTLGQAIRSFIQWPKSQISIDPQPLAAPPSPVLHTSPTTITTTKSQLPKKIRDNSPASVSSPMKRAMFRSMAPKKTKTSTKEEKGKGRKGSGERGSVKKRKDTEGPEVYPYMLGLPFGNELFLSSTTFACRNLHQWYMKRCTEEKDLPQNITGFIKDEILHTGGTYFAISFEDLHLLFQYKELDTSLITAWVLYMIEEVGEGKEKIAFLDPGPISENEITHNMEGVVEYIFKVLLASHTKDYIIGAYNSGANWHWIMIAIDLQRGTVFYLDSKNYPSESMKPITTAIDRAFERLTQLGGAYIPKTGKTKLTHRFHFPCHKQPPGNNHCGFYSCCVMQEMVSSLPPYLEVEGTEERWEFPTNSLVEADFSRIRGQLCSFIKRQIINPSGDYYSPASHTPIAN
ncbi:hypothetical protein ACP4OV_014337 [Aristida adscensionis]